MRLPEANPVRALIRWQHAAGPFWPYVGAAPFLSLSTTGFPQGEAFSTTLRMPAHPLKKILRVVKATFGDGRLAVFADLPPTQTLAAAQVLTQEGFIVVPAIHRWVTVPAVLRCEALVAHLMAYAARVRRPRTVRGVVFLLDGDRAGPPGLRQARKPLTVFDNRYSYSSNVLPHGRFLRQQGVLQALWVSASGVAPDLQPYLSTLAEAGLAPELVFV